MRETAEEAGLALDVDSLVWFAHWTPGGKTERRFATWFFMAPAPEGAVIVDGGEIHEHEWIRPADALARHGAGDIELIVPTWVTLHELAGDVVGGAGVRATRARTRLRRTSPAWCRSTAGARRSGRATSPTTISTPRSRARGAGCSCSTPVGGSSVRERPTSDSPAPCRGTAVAAA